MILTESITLAEMLKNYIKTAWRNLTSNKFYLLITTSGLAIGLATGIMLLLWVQNEKSYDKFHKDYQHIYRLSSQFKSDGETIVWNTTPGPLSFFAQSIPAIESTLRFSLDYDQVIATANKSKILDGFKTVYADTSFFSVFDFRLAEGNKKNALKSDHAAMLTRETAEKLFGNQNALGRQIRFRGDVYEVAGILENMPENSSIKVDAVFPMAKYAQAFTAGGGNGEWKTIDTDLGNYNFATYVKLSGGADAQLVEKALSRAFKKAKNGETDTKFKLQKLADMHLISADGNTSAYKMVQVFMLVAILLLAIAGINYVNLSTARSLMRAKEVSVRKIIGARKSQLLFQFFVETALLFMLATSFAILIIYLLMPVYNDISGKQLTLSLSPEIWQVFLIAIGSTWLASSIYPALLLSSFKPTQALKGKISASLGSGAFRKGLVIIQFAISVVLIISTLVMQRQMKYIREKNLGYDKNYVFSVPLPDQVVERSEAVKNELDKEPAILNASFSNVYNISNFGSSTGDVEWQGKPQNSMIFVTQANIDPYFIPTLKIEFIEGGNYTGAPSDSNYLIVNESAVRTMGLQKPYVGQHIIFHNRQASILGVVKDFHFESLKNKIGPLIFTSLGYKNILYVRTTARDASQAIGVVAAQYKKYAGDIPFSYTFADEQFREIYAGNQKTGVLFNAFAGIAIFISCLGLLGLATYTAQVRTKEIGVRKVLGASIPSIVKMMSMDFLRLIAIAIVVALPLGWYFTNRWLKDFAYRIESGWDTLVIAAVIAVLVAVFTISFQSIKVAMANPVKSLRSE